VDNGSEKFKWIVVSPPRWHLSGVSMESSKWDVSSKGCVEWIQCPVLPLELRVLESRSNPKRKLIEETKLAKLTFVRDQFTGLKGKGERRYTTPSTSKPLERTGSGRRKGQPGSADKQHGHVEAQNASAHMAAAAAAAHTDFSNSGMMTKGWAWLGGLPTGFH
jgi:hypothetical protein